MCLTLWVSSCWCLCHSNKQRTTFLPTRCTRKLDVWQSFDTVILWYWMAILLWQWWVSMLSIGDFHQSLLGVFYSGGYHRLVRELRLDSLCLPCNIIHNHMNAVCIRVILATSLQSFFFFCDSCHYMTTGHLHTVKLKSSSFIPFSLPDVTYHVGGPGSIPSCVRKCA